MKKGVEWGGGMIERYCLTGVALNARLGRSHTRRNTKQTKYDLNRHAPTTAAVRVRFSTTSLLASDQRPLPSTKTPASVVLLTGWVIAVTRMQVINYFHVGVGI